MVSKGFLKEIAPLLPEVSKPAKSLSLRRKLLWTGLAAALYLIMGQIPLYGVGTSGQDPFGVFGRVIFASQRGTLLELGIGPIITAGIILQLLKGAEIIRFDFEDPEERGLFTTATKFLTIVLALVQTVAFLLAGLFGSPSIPATVAIFIQLSVANIIIMMLDELVQKGWGIGSGISLFIAVGVSQQILWSLFNPFPIPQSQGGPFGGLIPFMAWLVSSGNSLAQAIARPGTLPSLIGFFTTIIVTIGIIYAEGVRVEIPISYARHRGFRGRYPVKLMYVSVMPVIFAGALVQNIFLISQVQYSSYNYDFLNWMGTFDTQGNPVGGLAYYVTSPTSIVEAASAPLRSLTSVAFMVFFSMIFAVLWVEIGGLSAEDVADNLMGSGMQVPGFRRRKGSIGPVLRRYIPAVTVIGGFLVGLLASVGQILAVFGGGTGLLLLISILHQLQQQLVQEQLEEIHPALQRVLQA